MEPIYIETWLHDRIRRLAVADRALAAALGKDDLATINRQDIDRYHLYRLNQVLSYAVENGTYYRKRYDNLGTRPAPLHSLAEYGRLPLTDPADFAANPYHFVCVPLGDVHRVTTFTSSGTTGPEKRVFFTAHDLECMTDFMSVGIRAVASADDVVQILLPKGRTNDQSDLLLRGVQKMGARAIASGIVPNAEAQLAVMAEAGTTVLFGVVNTAYRITQAARLHHDLSRLGVKALFLTSEYLSDAMRAQLQAAWGCPVHIHYGLTEMGLGVAVECGARHGFHYNEADLYVEVVDPETGQVLEDGQEGELVFTSLSYEGTPLLRYRTHDISRIIPETCPCGATTLRRFENVTRRREAIVTLADGEQVYPALFDEVIYRDANVIDFRVVLKKEGLRDRLLLQVEAIEQGPAQAAALEARLLQLAPVRRGIKSGAMLRPTVEFVAADSLFRPNRAKRIIVDER